MADEISIEIHFFNPDERKRADELIDRLGARQVQWYEGSARAVIDADCVSEVIASNLTVQFQAVIANDSPALAAANIPRKQLSVKAESSLRKFAIRSRRVRSSARGFEISPDSRSKDDPMLDGLPSTDLAQPFEGLESKEVELLPKDYYVLRTHAAVGKLAVEQLKEIGIEPLGIEGDNIFRLCLNPTQVEQLRTMNLAESLRRYGIEDTASNGLVELLESPESGALESGPLFELFDVAVHQPEDIDIVLDLARSDPAGEIVERGRQAFRVKLPVKSPTIAALLNHPAVRRMGPYVRPEFELNFGREMLGVGKINHPSEVWTGKGETVAVFDSGVDISHPDLSSVTARKARAGSAEDFDGHGSHVCGIVCGSGAESGGLYKGIAPGAKVISFGITDERGAPDLPPDLGDLLRKAIDDKDDNGQKFDAKIINLSWIIPYLSDYEVQGEQVDRFIYENPEVLVVVAAGNKGKAVGGKHSLSTVGIPATAKNVLAVGACCSNRSGGAIRFGQLDAGSFAVPPAATESVFGEPDRVAAFSGRGPTRSLAIKPDIVAPGTAIISARATHGTRVYFDGPVPQADITRYAALNGTSMAAPSIAGTAAILRQFLREQKNHSTPTSALLKALLIASCDSLQNADVNSTFPSAGYPGFNQGFGRPALEELIQTGVSNVVSFVFDDVRNNAIDAITAHQPPAGTTKSHHAYRVQVDTAQAPLRVVLVWTDVPSPSIYNKLMLMVEKPDGSKIIGNHNHRGSLPSFLASVDPLPENVSPENFNNVKIVDIPQAQLPAGKYRITVKAVDTPKPQQGYAIVALGSINGPLTRLM